MTPKEKAEELVDKFIYIKDLRDYGGMYTSLAKQCALMAVDEIICSNPYSNPFNTNVYSTMSYWNKVKQEIESL